LRQRCAVNGWICHKLEIRSDLHGIGLLTLSNKLQTRTANGASCGLGAMPSDVKFHEIFGREISHEIFREIFLKYFKNFTGVGRIVHCNKVRKPVKGKYLMLCVNNIIYFLLTSYTLITFLKVLSHFIMKIKNFMKYFKEGVLKYFKISVKFLNISKLNISSCIPSYAPLKNWLSGQPCVKT